VLCVAYLISPPENPLRAVATVYFETHFPGEEIEAVRAEVMVYLFPFLSSVIIIDPWKVNSD